MEYLDSIQDGIVPFLTGTSQYTGELQAFWMAIQGCMVVRDGMNKDKHMKWFHSFVISVIAGYGGGLLGFIWMGKPSSMLSNDLNIGSCILAWLIVNILPFDIGYQLCKTLPIVLITTSFAQLFRSTAIVRFVKVCFQEFQQAPSAYYPIPVFGPILYATLLGNMSGFILKGVNGHVANGMPWPFQNGIFCATFYHFYANDKNGIIGVTLRNMIPSSSFPLVRDDETFAACMVSAFMQIMGLLQLPILLGPSFSPFTLPTIGGGSSSIGAISPSPKLPEKKATISGSTSTLSPPPKPQPEKKATIPTPTTDHNKNGVNDVAPAEGNASKPDGKKKRKKKAKQS